MYKLFLFLFLLAAYSGTAQSLTGVWEGVVKLNQRGTRTMNFRLELLQGDEGFYGVFYTRGSEKGTVYGCDFIVTGQLLLNNLRLRPKYLQRAVVISSNECRYLSSVALRLNKDDSSVMTGTWVWQSEVVSELSCKKVSNEVSLSALDELTDYKNKLYELYEDQKIFLSPEDRLNVPVKVVQADSATITVEIFSVEKSSSDSVEVYVNEELIMEAAPLAVKPVRIVLESLEPGENGLLLVNRSKTKASVKLLLRIRYKNEDFNFETIPTFTRNMLVVFKRA